MGRLTEQTEAEFARELERLIRSGLLIPEQARRQLLTELATLRTNLRRRVINSQQWQQGIDDILAEIDEVVRQAAADIQRVGMDAQRRAWLAGEQRTRALLEIGEEVSGGVQRPFFLEPAPRPGFQVRAPIRPVILDAVQRQFTFDRIVQVTSEMQSLIQAQVLSGWVGQQSPFQVMQNITHIVGIRDLPGFRQLGTTGISAKGERIFRTELMTAQNMSALNVMRDEQARFPDLQKIWLSTGDDRTRDSHIDAHGQTVPVDEPFTVGGAEGDGPHDPGLPIRERANCRCTAAPYRESWGDQDALLAELNTTVEAERERRAAEGWYVRYDGWRILAGRRRRERIRVAG